MNVHKKPPPLYCSLPPCTPLFSPLPSFPFHTPHTPTLSQPHPPPRVGRARQAPPLRLQALEGGRHVGRAQGAGVAQPGRLLQGCFFFFFNMSCERGGGRRAVAEP
jgi:hypothetical protein